MYLRYVFTNSLISMYDKMFVDVLKNMQHEDVQKNHLFI